MTEDTSSMPEPGPLGTMYGTCPTCKNEGDMICPCCHPECEAAFKLILAEGAGPALPPEAAAPTLGNDLDHIVVKLSGDWPKESLRALAMGFQAAAEAAKADGLGLFFFPVVRARKAGSSIIDPHKAGGGVIDIRKPGGIVTPPSGFRPRPFGRAKP